MTGIMVVSFGACGNATPGNSGAATTETAADSEEPEPMTGMANPWRDCTEEEAYQYAPNGFSAPEGATNIHWSMMDTDDDPTNIPGPMIQLTFDLDGLSFCAREQMVPGEEIVDISGMYYDWQDTEKVTLANWGGGNMPAEIKIYDGEEEDAQICLWFDIETGAAYSLSVAAKDLDGFDIQAVAEAIYDPAKQVGANIPDSEEEPQEEAAESTLPPYEYPGPELFYSVLYQYLVDELSTQYEPADVSIPCPEIVAIDDSNKDDILVYGNFWIFNYDQNGDTLDNVSGGSYPGVVHMKNTDSGYEVTGMEVVEDGSDFDESAKKIFGKYYDDFSKIQSNDQLLEETRAQIIANYAAANDLSITAYQDYGWDPVSLPKENIDSFYSDLD